MLDLELASRITIITNRALCGGDAALLARIADFAAAGVSEIVVREKDLDEATYAALFENILRACEFYDRADRLSFDADQACPHEILPNKIRAAKFDAAEAHEEGFGTGTARSDGIFAEEVCARAIPHKIYDDRACAVQALVGGLDASAAYADKISLCERSEDKILLKKLHLGDGKSGFCADTARKHAATDEIWPKNSACVLDEILSENFTGAANRANDNAPSEISLRGAASETKPAAGIIQSAGDAGIAQNRGSAESAESAHSAEKANGIENVKEAENSQGAEGTQSAESARRLPAIFVHNFSDFALRAGERNLWLPLGVLRSFSAARGAEFLRANFKKLVASCHSEAEAREALELGASAICLSHIFATDCKAGLAPKGLNLIRTVRRFYDGEIYALGGITPRNFASVLRAGADRIAVMSSAMTARDASDFIRKFKK
ncbi:thiamine phosphate synthase [uncultured Campylobacter sp.]|uniref:thiamine phosphate synthase n=1 Tax=uncultured Campylobacter sp. TaxID=218934 RepID=UPI0026142F77|nr:thiamine phosphate synthase [uncultured Campylobacter sp.]